MTRTWLVVDSQNLCYRALYSTGGLSYGGQSTGTVFGFFREILQLQKTHSCNNFAFCFDRGKSLREQDYQEYKQNRRAVLQKMTDEEWESRRQFRQEVWQLRDEYLPEIGFKNVFSSAGYEADDIIASVCQTLPPGDRAVIVSSDHDFYQLLDGDRIRLWKPGKKCFYTSQDLAREFHGLEPSQWAMVKALAGCPSDGVVGIKGVGEITAAKYLRGLVKPESAAGKKIEGETVWRRNLPLVRLPYKGTPTFALEVGQTSPRKWRDVCGKLGFKSLVEGF